MIAELTRHLSQLTAHLGQSTFFALAAGLLTVAFRKNRAGVRYWLWLSASLKFFVPFALLMSLGTSLQPLAPAARQIAAPAISYTIEQFSEPFFPYSLPTQAPAPTPVHWIPTAILSIWLCGFAVVAVVRFRNWQRVHQALRTSTPCEYWLQPVHSGVARSGPSNVQVRISPGLLEPGVVGLWRPTLLLPEGIETCLTPNELNAVLAHELSHIRRHDNLIAAIHMIVEAIFWFHPLVWWIGARLVEERERACDEEVLSQGNRPDVYADAILNVCKLYVESPLACVSGVSGAGIRQRIEAIMSNRGLQKLNRTKKFLLASAGFASLALPVLVGLLLGLGHPSPIRAQSPAIPIAHAVPISAPIQLAQVQTPPMAVLPTPAVARPKFEVASIRPCDPNAILPGGRGRGGGGGGGASSSPDRVTRNCVTVMMLLQDAYVRFADGQDRSPFSLQVPPLEGAPAWLSSERYTVEVKADTESELSVMLGPMMQSLLEDRFHLKLHRENRNVPGYELTLAKGGSKLKPYVDGSENCSLDLPPGAIPKNPNGRPLLGFGPDGHFEMPRGGSPCNFLFNVINGPNRLLVAQGMDPGQFFAFLVRATDHPIIDKTGLTGRFDVRLEYAPDLSVSGILTASPPDAATDVPADAPLPAALEQQLGLKLVPVRATRDFIVIDHIERPTEN